MTEVIIPPINDQKGRLRPGPASLAGSKQAQLSETAAPRSARSQAPTLSRPGICARPTRSFA
jgi:hypothetical protein